MMTKEAIEELLNQEHYTFVESVYNSIGEVYEAIYFVKPNQEELQNFINNYEEILEEEEYERRKSYLAYNIEEIENLAEDEERDLTEEEEEKIVQLEDELQSLKNYRS